MLSCKNLSRRYGDLLAVDDVSFDIPAGQVTGFVGGNGADKTTTMRILMGLLTPTSGEVFWNGQPITAAIRRNLGYMPEERACTPSNPSSASSSTSASCTA